MSIFRQVLLVAILGALAIGGYQAWQGVMASDAKPAATGGGGDPLLVEAARAETRVMSTIVEAVGTTIAASSVEIVSLVEGRIEAMSFRGGETVTAGQTLVELDRDLQEADIKEAEARLTRVKLELERVSRLHNSNIVSTARMEEMTSEKATAEAAIIRARRNLADRTIVAPFSGTIGLNRVDAGARVSENTVITTLDDLSHVEVEFAVPENLFGTARVGQQVEATSAAYPGRIFTGTVVEIDSRIDAASRAFRVRAGLPNEDGALPAGMFMQVSMQLTGAEATVIPEEAVIAENGAAFVFTVSDGTATRKPVTTGRRAFGIVEITDGIDADAMVVTRGNAKLRDGMAITLAGAPQDRGDGG